MEETELNRIICMKKGMLKKPLEQHSHEYKNLYLKMERLCMEYCKHIIERDEIDISPESSRVIKYCILCECTFL